MTDDRSERRSFFLFYFSIFLCLFPFSLSSSSCDSRFLFANGSKENQSGFRSKPSRYATSVSWWTGQNRTEPSISFPQPEWTGFLFSVGFTSCQWWMEGRLCMYLVVLAEPASDNNVSPFLFSIPVLADCPHDIFCKYATSLRQYLRSSNSLRAYDDFFYTRPNA